MRRVITIKILLIIIVYSFGCSPSLKLSTGVSFSSRDGQFQVRIDEDSTFNVHTFMPPRYYRYCEGVLYKSSSQKFEMEYSFFYPKSIIPKVEENKLDTKLDSIIVSITTKIWPNELKYFSCIVNVNGKDYDYDLQKDQLLLYRMKIDSIKVALKYDDTFTTFDARYKDFATLAYIPQFKEIDKILIHIPIKREHAYYEVPNSQLAVDKHNLKFSGAKLFEVQKE